MNKIALFFLGLIAALVASIALTGYVGIKSGELQKKVIQPLSQTLSEFNKALSSPAKEISTGGTSDNFFATSSSTTTVIINGKAVDDAEQKTQKPTTPAAPARECYRYTITHLDGSTSNLCYSRTDYNSLLNLGGQLSGAKSFYQFHLDGAQRYQDEYDRNHSAIYLDAKASEEQQAKREQEKVGSITLQMQQIEQRGY